MPGRGYQYPAPNRNGGTIIAKHASHIAVIDSTFDTTTAYRAYYYSDYYANGGTHHAGYSQFNAEHRAEPAHRKSGWLVPVYETWGTEAPIDYRWIDAEFEPPC